ncbi:MAG: radical SAM protein [Deltaproteobacteria bacterium]|nr:radical SAM protein [Candidatus Anaeroferrophillacea bacterium]
MQTASTHIFGPVPSRRLGRSLGLDLVPLKTCSFDCLYCELGRTPEPSAARRAWVPAAVLERELTAWFSRDSVPPCDFVTLSGSGEPTLNRDLPEIVAAVRRRTSLPLALLTNSSLFSDPEVRRAARLVDVVLPSLDAVTPEIFRRINRPAAGIDILDIIAGLEAFRAEFAGEIWLEILFCAGINDGEAEIDRLAAVVRRLGADRVQLNTVARPGAYAVARPVDGAFLARVRPLFGEHGEIVAPFCGLGVVTGPISDRAAIIVDVLRRRPCTATDLRNITGMPAAELIKLLELLADDGIVVGRSHGGEIFFEATGGGYRVADRSAGTDNL